MPHYLLNMLSALLALILISGCSADSSQSRAADVLYEQVSTHYLTLQDTSKLAALDFLIEHLDVQFYHQSARIDDIKKGLRLAHGSDRPTLNMVVDSICESWSNKRNRYAHSTHPDSEVLTPEILIENIDLAFEAWADFPWREHYSFDDFCNYVLPYKSGDGPPQMWRQVYYDSLAWFRDSVINSNDILQAARKLKWSGSQVFHYIFRLPGPNSFGPMDLWETKSGNCYQGAHLRVSGLRSAGFPAVYMYTPQWGNHLQNHAWAGVVDTNGALRSVEIQPATHQLIAAKLYAIQYARNPEGLVAVASKTGTRDIPLNLNDARMIDISADLMPVSDITVDLKYASRQRYSFVYLCLAKLDNWNPVAWTHVEGYSARFRDVGRQTLMLPAYYAKGRIVPAGDPVTADFYGNIRSIPFDTSEWISADITRKYPIFNPRYAESNALIGLVIEGSKGRSFSNPDTLHVIQRSGGSHIKMTPERRERVFYHELYDSVDIQLQDQYQYLRITPPTDALLTLAEFEVYNRNGAALDAVITGSADCVSCLTDGLHGEVFQDTSANGWIVLDLHEPQHINRIRWLPIQNNHGVATGNRYELFYWDRKWVSLGAQTADSPVLHYRIPKSAVLWLDNLDGPRVSRPFIFDQEANVQVFY